MDLGVRPHFSASSSSPSSVRDSNEKVKVCELDLRVVCVCIYRYIVFLRRMNINVPGVNG